MAEINFRTANTLTKSNTFTDSTFTQKFRTARYIRCEYLKFGKMTSITSQLCCTTPNIHYVRCTNFIKLDK